MMGGILGAVKSRDAAVLGTRRMRGWQTGDEGLEGSESTGFVVDEGAEDVEGQEGECSEGWGGGRI